MTVIAAPVAVVVRAGPEQPLGPLLASRRRGQARGAEELARVPGPVTHLLGG